MADVEKLVLKREWFSVEKAWDGCYPLCHPLIGKNGIDMSLVEGAVDDALELVACDLNNPPKNLEYLKQLAKEVERKDGKIGRGNLKPEGHGFYIEPFPLVGHVYIGPRFINPYNEHGDQGIKVDDGRGEGGSVTLFTEQPVPEELLREFEVTGSHFDSYWKDMNLSCPFYWRPHNVARVDAIVFSRIALALSNATVRKKYS